MIDEKANVQLIKGAKLDIIFGKDADYAPSAL
jgi:hypothetical protein